MADTITTALPDIPCVSQVSAVAKKPPTDQIRIDAEFAKRLRSLAEFLGVSAGEYVVDKLGPLMQADLNEMADAIRSTPSKEKPTARRKTPVPKES